MIGRPGVYFRGLNSGPRAAAMEKAVETIELRTRCENELDDTSFFFCLLLLGAQESYLAAKVGLFQALATLTFTSCRRRCGHVEHRLRYALHLISKRTQNFTEPYAQNPRMLVLSASGGFPSRKIMHFYLLGYHSWTKLRGVGYCDQVASECHVRLRGGGTMEHFRC